MKVVFTIKDSAMCVTPGRIMAMDAEKPIIAADFWQDILCDALREYNKARVRCGWEPSNSFSVGNGA